MKTGKIDARILKSKKAIQNAFKELIQIQDLSEITISELTEKAGVTRSTYYLYYQKVSDVRDDIENCIIEKIESTLSKVDFVKSMLFPYPLLKKIFDVITEEDSNNKFVFVGRESNYMLDKISETIVSSYVDLTKNTSNDVDINRVSFTANFIASGICATFKKWYTEGCQISLDELCKELSDSIVICFNALKVK